MADRIIATVARTNAVAEQAATGDAMHSLIQRFATAAIYRDPAEMDVLSAKILARFRIDYVPLANEAGVRNADQLLVGIEKRVGEGEARRLTARAAGRLRRDTHKNLLNLSDGLRSGKLELRSETVAELRRSRFGVETRRDVMRRLSAADKADMASWEKFQTEHRSAVRDENAALKRLAKEPTPDNLASVEEAQAEQKSAKRRVLRRRSFLARFENLTHRELVDAVRVQTRVAQDARFRQLGFTERAMMTWITVNGADTCPDCTPMHGVTKPNSEWDGQRPGSGWTVCEQSCMCQLVPESYSVGNESVSGPLLGPRTPRDRSTAQSVKSNTPLPTG